MPPVKNEDFHMKIIAGNWKMNGTPEANRIRLEEIKASADTSVNRVIVLPPFLSLPDAAVILAGSAIAFGAQNCHFAPAGAYTGEVSAPMLKAVGCGYCLVGHSERRQFFHEDSAFLKAKIEALREVGIIPIFCVGESLSQREDGSFPDVIAAQLSQVLMGMEALNEDNFVIGYEPVWAIGTGKTATPEDADATMGLIREVLAKINQPVTLPLLYGGSAKPDNAAALLSKKNIDGLLIGGAALKPLDFAAMTKAKTEVEI